MTSYSGNPSLGDEVKQRIVGTFEQSLDLAERGRSQEALLGCDFILELDPEFEPARALKERLEGGGEPDVGDLRPGAAPPSGEGGGRPEESFGDLFDLDSLELPDLEEPSGPPPGPSAAGATEDLASDLRRRLNARDYQAVLDRAGEDRERVAADPELASIVETAQARLEALPYVESFLQKAGTALRSGDREAARQALAKARSLDPEHPLLEDLEAEAGEADRPAAAQVPPAEGPAEPEAAAEPEPGFGDEEFLGGYELPDLDSPSPEPPETPEDSPSPEPPGPATGDDRIAQLLDEGQRHADEGNLQEAIDAWSRIFLIDVDHEEAARRIEDARRRKAERERRVEEVFHEGLASLEEGDADTARRRFERVLELHPGHLAARSYLDQLDSGEPAQGPPAGAPTGAETMAVGELGSFDLSDISGPREGGAGRSELQEEILVPPPPGGAGADRERPADEAGPTGALPSYGKAVAGKDPGRRTFLLVGGLVLVLVLAAAAVLYVKKDSLFPNSDVEEPVAEEPAAEPAPGPIERATELHERGQTAMALGLLRRIRPDDLRHAEAQELIARWEEPAEPEEEGATEALAPEALERRGLLLAAAETAVAEEEYLLASELYDRAGRIAELEGEHAERAERVEAELVPLEPEIELFREGEYELVLPRLWRLYQEDPTNRSVQRMIVASYYNRGVRQLQRGDPAGAAEEFEEALALAPDDRDLQRHYLLAQTYQRRPRDLLYRTYVKYLPLR